MASLLRLITFVLLASILLGCAASPAQDCPVTEPKWIKPPEDSAVLNPPAFGYYFVNEDQSIMASAGWAGMDDTHPHAGEEGVKVGWFRPAGADLIVTGQRLDGKSASFEAEIPCCSPTRFQASGLYFRTEGCWEVIARAEDKELRFIVWIEPEEK